MHAIPVRRVRFDGSDLTDRSGWFDGEPYLTHLCNALSLTFPLGERFFVDAVKRFRGERALEGMDADIKAFIGQEAHHGRAHEEFNEWLLDGVEGAEIFEKIVRATLDEGRLRQSPMEQLATTCALEHFTAVLAELLLSDPEMQAKIHPAVRRLLMWHSIEETEHKAVAFDVYRAMGGTYAMRVRVMLEVTINLLTIIGALRGELMKRDGTDRDHASLRRTRMKLAVTPGYLRRIIPNYLAYYRRDFHPWHRDPAAVLDRARDLLGFSAAA